MPFFFFVPNFLVTLSMVGLQFSSSKMTHISSNSLVPSALIHEPCMLQHLFDLLYWEDIALLKFRWGLWKLQEQGADKNSNAVYSNRLYLR